MILAGGTGCGFIECNYEELELWRQGRPHLMLSELHIAPSQQKKGYGERILTHLLSKGMDIELIVANVNKPMNKLIKKFAHRVKYENDNVRTIVLTAPRIADNTEMPNKSQCPTA